MKTTRAIGHAEMRIGDSVIMMGGATEQWRAAPAALYVYVEDTDAAYQRGLAAGGTSLQEPADQVGWRPDCGRQGPLRQPVVHRHPPRSDQRRGDEKRNQEYQAKRAKAAGASS